MLPITKPNVQALKKISSRHAVMARINFLIVTDVVARRSNLNRIVGIVVQNETYVFFKLWLSSNAFLH